METSTDLVYLPYIWKAKVILKRFEQQTFLKEVCCLSSVPIV